MPAKAKPWIKVEVAMTVHRKLADLPSDSARWGWLVLLAAAKVQHPQGSFASVGVARQVAGRFARFIPHYMKGGLLEDAGGTVAVHDWPKYQWDPTNADRQALHRNGEGNSEGNGQGNGHLAYAREGDSRQETPPSTEGGIPPELSRIELAVRGLLNGGGSEGQIEAFEGYGEQLGEVIVLRVCTTWEQSAVRDRYGHAKRELQQLAKSKRGRLRAVDSGTDYDSLMQTDDSEKEAKP